MRVGTPLSVRLLGVVALSFILAFTLLAGPTAAIQANGVVTAAPEPTTASTGASDESPEDATIEELYPNPVADDNVGEYLIVDLPKPGNWTLTDGYHETPLPEGATGRVALSRHPTAATAHVDRRVYRLPEHFPLSARGDRIVLRYEGIPVDVVAYERAREAEVWNRAWAPPDAELEDPSHPDDSSWRPYGFVPREPAETGSASGEVYVLPDSPGAPVEPLEGSSDRLYVAAYTFDSARVADTLVAAADRGADARLLVEGTPVGGFPAESERHLDRLVDAGVDVRVLDGQKGWFAFHHAKYAVADDRAVVLTENWKPAGTGGAGSRGWGVTLDDPETAAELATIFEQDAGWRAAQPWTQFQMRTTTYETGRADGSYPQRFDPTMFETQRVEVLTAPGNAEDRIEERIAGADERVYAVVPRTGGPDQRLVQAVAAAADRGVETRLLLSGAWYDREENAALVEDLGDGVSGRTAPVEATVTDGRGRYAKLHAKGLVIDDTVILGSLNWNDRAAGGNREVLVAIESPEAAAFFVRVLRADWRGGGIQLPLGFLAGFAAALVGAASLAAREVEFVEP